MEYNKDYLEQLEKKYNSCFKVLIDVLSGVFITIIMLSGLLLVVAEEYPEKELKLTILAGILLIFATTCLMARFTLITEINYFKCNKCKTTYKADMVGISWSIQIPIWGRRLMRCPKCNRWSFHRVKDSLEG